MGIKGSNMELKGLGFSKGQGRGVNRVLSRCKGGVERD